MSASSTDMGNGKNNTNREPDTKLENVFFFINGVFIEHRKLTVLQKKRTTGGGVERNGKNNKEEVCSPDRRNEVRLLDLECCFVLKICC